MAPVCRRLSLLVMAAILVGLPARGRCGHPRGPHRARAGSKFVDEVSNTSTSTIAVGDTVQWTWSAGTHSTTSGTCAATCTADGRWNSGQHSSPFTFSHTATFATVGTYHYFCSVHGTMMQGDVIVVEPEHLPIIEAVDPDSGPAGGATAITITGTDFVAGATVTIGGVAATGVVVQGSTAIQAMTPALPPGTLADVTVTVQNPDTLVSTLLGGWFADFTDVAGGDPFHDFVEQLVRNGVTAGCGSGAYCRDDSVTRAQMAVFLLKSKLGSGHVPPPCTGRVRRRAVHRRLFDPWIEELASLRSRAAASPCRSRSTARQHGQPAADGGLPPQGAPRLGPRAARVHGNGFRRRAVHGRAFDPWIEELASLGVTGGCQVVPVPLYCPTNPNTRGQMAVFSVKAFSFRSAGSVRRCACRIAKG